uniref:COV1-like protein n=1 Tax=Oryza meridionalis TaxID=40149 RepID=A0A0E0DRW5_9ORYZ
MADQRRRFRGGGDWQASVNDVVDDGGELEAAAAAAAARGSVLSGEYQAQEMSTMVSALTWVLAAGHDDHGAGGQWSGLVDVPATTLAAGGSGGGDYGHGAQGSYYYYGAAPTATPDPPAGAGGATAAAQPVPVAYPASAVSDYLQYQMLLHGGGGGGGGRYPLYYGGAAAAAMSSSLGPYSSIPTSSVTVASVPSSSSAASSSSGYGAPAEHGEAVQWTSWPDGGGWTYPATTSSWSGSSQYPPPPRPPQQDYQELPTRLRLPAQLQPAPARAEKTTGGATTPTTRAHAGFFVLFFFFFHLRAEARGLLRRPREAGRANSAAGPTEQWVGGARGPHRPSDRAGPTWGAIPSPSSLSLTNSATNRFLFLLLLLLLVVVDSEAGEPPRSGPPATSYHLEASGSFGKEAPRRAALPGLAMPEEKEYAPVPLGQAPEAVDPEDPVKSPPRPTSPANSTRKACFAVLQSWVSRKFMTGCVVLFPVAVTFFITWWFIKFVDGFFSPLYAKLGFDIFGLGFLTSLLFIFLVGIFVSSWVGSTVFWIGEWFIKKMPFVRHIYSASKQVSTAVSPDQNTTAFKEVAIISHPRIGEYAFGFITSTMILQTDKGDEELCSVYVPTNHLYIGDIFLVRSEEIIRPNLSIREGIEIIVSGGMTMPQVCPELLRESKSVNDKAGTR